MSRRPFLFAVAVCGLVALTPSNAAEPPARDPLAEHFPGVEVARCMFPQGKVVLKRGEALHVLRQGDAVPGFAGLRVLEITDRHAVLIQGPEGSGKGAVPAVPERLVKIEKRPDGEVTVTVLSARLPRVEGPELQGGERIYSPWSEDAGKAQPGEDDTGIDAPLVAPRRVDGPVPTEDPRSGGENR